MGIVCLVLCIRTFEMYVTLSTLLIPRDLHRNDTCEIGVKFALVVYLMFFGMFDFAAS